MAGLDRILGTREGLESRLCLSDGVASQSWRRRSHCSPLQTSTARRRPLETGCQAEGATAGSLAWGCSAGPAPPPPRLPTRKFLNHQLVHDSSIVPGLREAKELLLQPPPDRLAEAGDTKLCRHRGQQSGFHFGDSSAARHMISVSRLPRADMHKFRSIDMSKLPSRSWNCVGRCPVHLELL